jgi:hypothetical protein
VGAAGVKCGDTGGGTAEASRIPHSIGMAKPTEIVEDRAEMAESSGTPSGMAETIRIFEAIEMNEAIATSGAC